MPFVRPITLVSDARSQSVWSSGFVLDAQSSVPTPYSTIVDREVPTTAIAPGERAVGAGAIHDVADGIANGGQSARRQRMCRGRVCRGRVRRGRVRSGDWRLSRSGSILHRRRAGGVTGNDRETNGAYECAHGRNRESVRHLHSLNPRHVWIACIALSASGCRHRGPSVERPVAEAAGAPRVRPGITVLLEDSVALVRGRRVALLTNQTGVDEHGTSDIELLRDTRARAAGITLVRLFSPEHGIRGTEDREHIESGVDERSGLTVTRSTPTRRSRRPTVSSPTSTRCCSICRTSARAPGRMLGRSSTRCARPAGFIVLSSCSIVRTRSPVITSTGPCSTRRCRMQAIRRLNVRARRTRCIRSRCGMG